MAKEIVAMILAGGRGSRLYALTQKTAKPAVSFGGKYRIVDFPLSNCVNSDIDTVGIATQYQPQKLNEYIGNGQPWDLDRLHGGVHTLPPNEQANGTDWYKGTANAIYQNIGFIDSYDPEYVIWFHTEDRKTKPSLMLSMLLDSKKSVDAAVCYNDQIALAGISMQEEKGISVPEDIAVTGYDNSLIGQSSPIGFSTIAHPQEKLGEMAAELILEKIRKVPEEESRVKRLIYPELIVRESTAGKNLSTETKK